jgi:membrane peptidoglycan carboxypeptidase
MSTWRPIPRPAFWKQWLPEWLHGPARLLGWTSLIGTICALGLGFFYFLLAMRFDLEEVARLPGGSQFLDRRGVELPGPSGASQRLAAREDIPDFLVKALQAREDARFFNHSGVDFRGLGRATLRNLKDRDFTQGASTLSMQLARNTYKNLRAKSVHRKFLEIALTLRIENHYQKDEILTHYLNRIYFGSGSHGIEQAARTYFDKFARDLSDGECAMIVGIIRGPHIFSPLRNLEAAIEQRNQTLERMVAMNFITEAQRTSIAARPVELAKEDTRSNQRSYAMEAVRREYERILDDADIRLGGLQIKTTLDAAWQSRLETELTRAVAALESEKDWPHPAPANHAAGLDPIYLQFAAVTLETGTGAMLALIGGRDFSHSRYDRTHALRDLGSAFEPFVAAAAAERGKLVLPGRPIQTGRQIGPAEVARIAKRFGLGGGLPFNETEDLFRGTVSATPLQMSIGLATLGNKGNRPKPYLIQEIRDSEGKLLYTATPHLTSAISANAAEEATSVLQRHAGTRCFTGATGSERDAWTLRLGPTGSTAIWIGFDKPTAIARAPRLKSLLDEFVKRLGNQ